jgi:hypothetical protein
MTYKQKLKKLTRMRDDLEKSLAMANLSEFVTEKDLMETKAFIESLMEDMEKLNAGCEVSSTS